MQDLYSARPHTLIAGIARIAGTDYRFRLWEHDGYDYSTVALDAVNPALPILFKPLGTSRPDPTYIASDADFVDYITELMGGFGVPRFVKQYRQDKQYLVMGLRLTRDTQRMILSDLIVDAASPAGWVLIANPTAKERRYCDSKDLEHPRVRDRRPARRRREHVGLVNLEILREGAGGRVEGDASAGMAGP